MLPSGWASKLATPNNILAFRPPCPKNRFPPNQFLVGLVYSFHRPHSYSFNHLKPESMHSINTFNSLTLVTLLTLTLLVGTANLFGQSDFQPGYIITNASDTLYGLIDNRSELRNMRVCHFKQTETSDPVEYLPGTIQGYRFNTGKFFISKSLNTKNVKDTVFVEFLLNGIVNLYYYKNLDFNAYYIEEAGKELVELESQLVPVRINETDYLIQDKRYIGLLTLALYDCKEIQKEITETRLSHKNLISLTKKYHDYVCTDEVCLIYEKKLPVLQVDVNPFVGMTTSTIEYHYISQKHIKLRPSFGAAFGLGFNFRLPRMNDRFSVQTNFAFQDQYFYGSSSVEIPQKYEYLHINYLRLLTSLALKYTYPKGKIKPLLLAGVCTAYTLKHSATLITEQSWAHHVVTTDTTHPNLKFKSPLGIYAGGGIAYRIWKQLNGFTQIEYYVNNKSFFGPGAKSTSLQLSTGISF
jgi:hypothetical protein